MAYKRRLYVGVRLDAERTRELFTAPELPTAESHGREYRLAIGPFRTRAGAEFMRDHGASNPHVQTVADAERLALSQQWRRGS